MEVFLSLEKYFHNQYPTPYYYMILLFCHAILETIYLIYYISTQYWEHPIIFPYESGHRQYAHVLFYCLLSLSISYGPHDLSYSPPYLPPMKRISHFPSLSGALQTYPHRIAIHSLLPLKLPVPDCLSARYSFCVTKCNLVRGHP